MSIAINLLGYQITEELYTGTRTLVYQGVRESDQQPVVIKLLRNEYPSFNELVQFRNQYTIAKNLDSSSIITTYSLEPYNNGYALVMEDFGGISLKQWTDKESGLALGDFLQIAIALCHTLHILCQERIIHKDIKPANILINPETKQIKLIDFSIASLLPRETQEIENANSLEGTLAYISPEQTGRMNRGIDYRSDFYSLGVTFYELLTGQLPFISNDPMELVHYHLAQTPIPIHEVNLEIPLVLSKIISKLMSKNAEDRYQSALGIKYDFELCLSQLQESGEIKIFEIGERDLSDRFTIPEKLYGREQEVQALLTAFDRIAGISPHPPLQRGALEEDSLLRRGALEEDSVLERRALAENFPLKQKALTENSPLNKGGGRGSLLSGSELMLVAGFSGIGKTAVINEVHKPIARQRGYFIKGKYDQFQRNIPFSAFVQAFRDLMGQLLSESDVQLQIWKAKILEVVGDNGQVLVDVIPELELIIGKQPTATELSGTAAQNRFNLLIQNFVKVFTSQEHPLVMFIDDLQWSDSASQNLLKLLMQDTKYLLILGAYRDNEVSPVHPFMLTVDEIVKSGAVVNTITLQSLSLLDTNYLVADTLHCELSIAQPLTKLIYQKTIGNPFFTTQFLKSLYEDKLISFDTKERYWQCDIVKVQALAITDDVVEFMALQLQKLPRETQNALKLAACIGAQFDLQALVIISENSPLMIATVLWRALQEGFVIPITKTYKFFTEADNEETFFSSANPTYRFLHDRVQQAAYSLIPEDQRLFIHWQIGKLLLDNIPPQKQDEHLFEIVNHLNIGKKFTTDLVEQIQLVQLNLNAGIKAKTANAYVAALTYFLTGIEELPQETWQSHYELTLSLYTSATEALYLSGDFEQMEVYAETTLSHTHDLLEKVPVYNIKIQAYMAQSHHLEALKLALKVLRLLDVELPDQPTQDDVRDNLERTKFLLSDKTATDILELPVMSDRKMQAAMQILTNIISAAYQAAPVLFRIIVLQQVQLSIAYGNTPESTYAYATYGLLLCGVLGDINAGYELGQMSLQLVSRLNAIKLKSKTLFAVNCFIRHWKDHVRDTLSPLVEAYTCGLETGDIEYAMMSAYVFGRYAYLSGQELGELSQAMMQYSSIMSQFKQTTYLNFNGIYHQSVLNLLEPTASPCALVGESYDEVKMLPLHQAANQVSIICQLHFCKLTLSYLFHEYNQALDNAEIVEKYLASVTGLVVIPVFYFYKSLTQLALFPNTPISEQSSILKEVTASQEKLNTWSQFAPQNYTHKVDLIQAEQHRILKQNSEAVDAYDRAISGAKANEYIQEEALANELAAKFYLDWGKEKVAAGYMQEAYYCYSRWGAKAKVVDLETRYPQLLQSILQQPKSSFHVLETLTNITHSATKVSSTSISDSLDFASVIKAAQALSSAIELDELLKQLTQIILQNSGGSKCILVLPQDNIWQVRAISTLETTELCSEPLDNYPDIPIKLIQYVKRTQSVVVIDNLQTDLPVIDDYLIQRNPKSILCLPILNQGNLAGILYLKNQATAGVFNSDRLTIINFLCTQAAISLENAQLYQQSQAYAQELQQTQLQMIQTEKMSALGNLVAGVAHEINNPVGFLNGNITPALDYINDLFELVDLYQQKYPQPDADIQEEIETIDLEYIREDLPKLVGSMREGVKRIADISTSLRTFSRADTDHPVACNIHDGIDSTIMILKHRLKANEFRPEIQVIKSYENLPQIECYAGQMNQVFMNILANAIDALDESSQDRTFADIKAKPNCITITTSVENNRVKIAITDNGKGMSEEVKAKVFDHLFTTKEVGKGTGLGLAIAQQIVVEKHGGAIAINSTLGQGTEFVISLPIK